MVDKKVKQNSYELKIFNEIKKYLKTVIDIGCRDNYDYFILAPEIRYHMFDINEEHINKIKYELKDIDNKICFYPFGLSDKNEMVTYSKKSESIHRHWGDHVTFEVKNFNEVFYDNNLEDTDFLKMDIEGSEPSILKFKNILSNISFIQFEYGETWDFNSYTLQTAFKDYSNTHDFYFIKDENHPVSNSYVFPIILKCDDKIIDVIHNWALKGAGCNILMINKELNYENNVLI